MTRTMTSLTFIIVAWFLGIVSLATWLVLTSPMEIPLSAVTVLGTIYGLPALAVGLWKWGTDNLLKVVIEDIDTGTRTAIAPNKENKYIFEYDPKKHQLFIRSR